MNAKSTKRVGSICLWLMMGVASYSLMIGWCTTNGFCKVDPGRKGIFPLEVPYNVQPIRGIKPPEPN